MGKYNIGIFLVAFCLVAGSFGCSAAETGAQLSASGFQVYVKKIKKEALEKGFSSSLLDSAYKDVVFIPKVVKADKNQPEKKETLDQYLPKVTAEWKVKKGKKALQENKALLEQTAKKYGVQPRFIVALWGIESSYGRWMGRHSVVGALTIMAYEGRRENFFKKQIFDALTILQQGHITPEKMKGSWAGAMGQCQFMPSSFLAYAQDGNNDGHKDIWTTKADVFASTANYLKTEGWMDHYTWGREVRLTKGISDSFIGLKTSQGKTLAEWQQLGVRKSDGSALPEVKKMKAWLVQPDDKKGRTYLVYQNYRVLMHWNHSHYFALAVGHLADRLGQ